MPKSRPLIVCAFRGPDHWRWLRNRIPAELCDLVYFPIHTFDKKKALPEMWHAVREVRRRGADMLLTHSPLVSVPANVMHRLLGIRAPHVAWSFHYDVVPKPAKAWAIGRALSGVDLVVVYTSLEIDMYHEAFGIPREKLRMVYWGVEPPDETTVFEPEKPIEAGEYVSAIGGSARDYGTFFRAMAKLPDIRAVAVMRPQNLEGLDVPPNVKVHVNLPYGRMQNVLMHSRFTAIPLFEHARSGLGVFTQAMHMRRPIVVSDVPGVRDYVKDGETALTCLPKNPEALAARIRQLWQDRAMGERLAERAYEFVNTKCTEDATLAAFMQVLREFRLSSDDVAKRVVGVAPLASV